MRKYFENIYETNYLVIMKASMCYDFLPEPLLGVNLTLTKIKKV